MLEAQDENIVDDISVDNVDSDEAELSGSDEEKSSFCIDGFDNLKTRLDEIVEEVSAEDISLDDALKLYEEAVNIGLLACDASEIIDESVEAETADSDAQEQPEPKSIEEEVVEASDGDGADVVEAETANGDVEEVVEAVDVDEIQHT